LAAPPLPGRISFLRLSQLRRLRRDLGSVRELLIAGLAAVLDIAVDFIFEPAERSAAFDDRNTGRKNPFANGFVELRTP
jgi:hypothetical protein